MCSICCYKIVFCSCSFSNVSDQKLIDVLNDRLSELHIPSNYPNLFSPDKASATDKHKIQKHDVLYIVSSEDEE